MPQFSLANSIKDGIYEYQDETPKTKRTKETPITIPEKVALNNIFKRSKKGKSETECQQKLRAIYLPETLPYCCYDTRMTMVEALPA
jgi:hypothetical protein